MVGLYDQRPEVAAELAEPHGTRSWESIEALTTEVEAVVLAVPTYAHASIGRSLLEAGCHLLIEKPIAASLAEADQLVETAARSKSVTGQGPPVLAVGHVEFFNPAVQALLGVGGQPRFIEIQRLSPFTPRSLDVDVILDLMIHDLQLLHALDGSRVAEVRASGIDVMSGKVDLAHARIELESGAVATVAASRVSAEPVRKLRVYLDQRYFSLDYRKQEIKGYGLREQEDRRVIVPEHLPVRRCEPLRAELEAFLAACRGEDVAYVDGRAARRALKTALAVRDAVAGRSSSTRKVL
jgi:predicted dehydrogenase